MMASRKFPPWYEVLVKENFFETCSKHHGNAKNRFCVNCSPSICPHYIFSHNSHRVLEIRKIMANDVLRLEDCSNLIDCSLIQQYTMDSLKVVFINETPQSGESQLSPVTGVLSVLIPYVHSIARYSN